MLPLLPLPVNNASLTPYYASGCLLLDLPLRAHKSGIMKRRKFVAITGTAMVIAGVTYYLLSDTKNFVRADSRPAEKTAIPLLPEERKILLLASLAPSGHNTQPWFIKYMEPCHWIIGNDKSRWLPGVDPTQRETILSIGAFLQNLEYAANNLGYNCRFSLLANTNQDENIMDVQLSKAGAANSYDTGQIIHRRTIRSNYLSDALTKTDSTYLLQEETDWIRYIPNSAKEHVWLNEQTIEANRIQAYRDDAQTELANWIRFSGKAAAAQLDGLTPASMEIAGLPAWYIRNFYDKKDVLTKGFREQSIDKVVKQVSQSAGWLLITSNNNSVATLLETGRRLQRLWLKIRQKNIAIHPMTQILEEASGNQVLNQSIGLQEPVQFILRTGYVKNYPEPVSLRRPVDQFIRT